MEYFKRESADTDKEIARLRSKLRGTKVTIGDDPSWTFDAAHVDNVRWNGWAMPWFTEEEGRKVAAISKAEYERDPDGMQEYVEYVPEASPDRRFWLIVPHEEESWIVDSITLDGVWVYAIGAANWTWEVADER